MAYDIHKTTVRERLPLREKYNEPYWGHPLGRGRAIGFRKVGKPDQGHWIARMRTDDSSKKYDYEPLGATPDVDYAKAKEAADQWFKLKADGVRTDEVVTVADACRAYVAERRKSKSQECAHDAEKRFERSVYGGGGKDGKRHKPSPISHVPLAKLHAKRVREWRDELGLSPGATNRTLIALKAALNLAVREKHASAALAIELRLVKPLPGGKNRRDVYLDIKQRRALLKPTKGALRDLIEGVALTGARAGELVKAHVSQFDARTKSMTFISGKGNDGPRSRTVPLSPSAVKLFERLTKGKARTDRIFQRDDGQPWAHSDWDELIREAAKAAELPAEPRTGVCLYTLRHCFITDALLGAIPTLEVARLVGTSVAMIEKHYGHLVASAARTRLAKVAML